MPETGAAAAGGLRLVVLESENGVADGVEILVQRPALLGSHPAVVAFGFTERGPGIGPHIPNYACLGASQAATGQPVGDASSLVAGTILKTWGEDVSIGG